MIKQEDFYLCMPDEEKSCGACCGLYNFIDHSREFITGILERRKKIFTEWSGDMYEYRLYMEDLEKNDILFPTIYTCPFLSFLDEEQKKVGCMIHPLHTGEDLRDVAFYGSKVCSEHRCVSYFYYRPVEIQAVLSFTHDWYLYGMVLHDIDFVKSFFKLLEDGIAREIKSEDLRIPGVREGFESYFKLKESWPYRQKGEKILDKYEFHGKEYRIRKVNTWGILEEKDPYYKIIRALESKFESEEEVTEAIELLRNIVDGTIIALTEEGEPLKT